MIRKEGNMKKEDIIRKLTSRKLWTAIASFVALLIVATGHTESEAAQMTAIIMAGASVIAYIVGEGLVDAAREEGIEYIEEDEIDE